MKITNTFRFLIIPVFTLILSILLLSCQSEQKVEGSNPVSSGSGDEITIISPNGGESIIAGSQFEIKWNSGGNGTVVIEYSADNGSSWDTIVVNYVNAGSYLWKKVPNVVSNECLIKVSTSDNQFTDQTDRAFGIITSTTKSLDLTSPSGGEELFVGQSYNIEWTSEGIQNVKIQYSINDGTSWVIISSSYPVDSTYLWTVPDQPSDQCLIKLTAVEADSIVSESANVFTITATRSLVVTSPNGGENWAAGTSQVITWTSENVDEVNIEYSINNGDTWIVLTENTASDGIYTWNPVSNNPTTSARIKITDAINSTPSDISDANFTISSEQELVIISPNGGENWPVGSSQLITWNSTGGNSPIPGPGNEPELFFNKKSKPLIYKPSIINSGITDVKLQFSTDAGATWQTISESTPNVGSFVWTQLPEVNSSLCKVKISDAVDGTPADVSDANFIITTNSTEEIIVTAPDGGEEWEAGTNQTIKWHSTSVSNVKIEYTNNNGVNWSTIVESTPSSGFYNWDPIPNTPSTNSRIRISNADGGFPSDMSENFFTILPEPDIIVLAPNGGETIQSSASLNINWSSVNIADVKIEYSTNGGASWNLIIASTASDGQYIWSPVPVLNSTLCRIRVSDASDGLPADISDENFTISDQTVKILEVTVPNGGESWLAGTTQNITWNATGVPLVDIEYSTDNGLSWTTIVTSAPGSGSYEWTPIPDVNSTQCRVRIKDHEDGSPSDESNAVFTIHPVQDLTITSPNGGEVYVAGDPVEITWQSQGVENIKIEYTVNNGILEQDWFTLVASTPSDGHYVTGFSIPSEQYRIRISDAEDFSPMDQSNGTFSVLGQPQISVTTPNGGEFWLVGETYEINWQSNNIEFVKIEYSTNGGFSWNTIVENTPSDGIYEQWAPTMADTSDNCLLRISDASDGAPSDVSNDFFTIHGGPQLRVIYPNGGEYVIKTPEDPTETIIWTSTGIANVGIEYTLNNGVTWTTLSSSYPSNGAYVWDLPTVASSLARIRIYDVSNPSFRDQSDAPFNLNVPTP